MSEYINGFQIAVNDAARIKFLDVSQLQLNPKEVIELVMSYDTFKQLYSKIGETIEQHDSKLASIKKAN